MEATAKEAMKHSKIRNAEELEHMRRRISDLLRERKLFPAELAAKAITPLSSLMRTLNGEVKNPGIDLVISIAKGLGVSIDDLLGTDYLPYRPADDEYMFLVEVKDKPGILHQMTTIADQEGVNITKCRGDAHGERARLVVVLKPHSAEQATRIGRRMADLLAQLREEDEDAKVFASAAAAAA